MRRDADVGPASHGPAIGRRRHPVDNAKRLAQVSLHADDCDSHPLLHRVTTDDGTAWLQAGNQLPKRRQVTMLNAGTVTMLNAGTVTMLNGSNTSLTNLSTSWSIVDCVTVRRLQSVSRSWLVGSSTPPVTA